MRVIGFPGVVKLNDSVLVAAVAVAVAVAAAAVAFAAAALIHNSLSSFCRTLLYTV